MAEHNRAEDPYWQSGPDPIPFYRVGQQVRFDQEEILAWLESRRQKKWKAEQAVGA